MKWLNRRIREESRVKDFILHGLRHTATSIMVSEALGRGAGLQDIMKILGHSKIETTLRYDHGALERMKLAMDTLEKRLPK